MRWSGWWWCGKSRSRIRKKLENIEVKGNGADAVETNRIPRSGKYINDMLPEDYSTGRQTPTAKVLHTLRSVTSFQIASSSFIQRFFNFRTASDSALWNATGMRALGTVSTGEFPSDRRRSRMRMKTNQTMLPFITFFLCVSSGLGDDKTPDCMPEHFGVCSSSACDYVRNVCDGDSECFLNLCAYLYSQEHDQLRFLHQCKDLVLECTEPFLTDETKSESKRGILNKNLAYLLLKLNPFFNQTSQFGFLTSGRIRRITGNFGTEFLGKRSNKLGGKSQSRGSGDGSRPKVRPATTPRFYSLPLNKFAQAKVLKRNDEYPEDVKNFRGKRTSIRGGHGGVILGSEFLGKRGNQDFEMAPPDGSMGRWAMEGKRGGESPIGDDLIRGSELLGKKNTRYNLGEFLGKKLARNRLEKQTGNELLGKKSEEPNDLYEGIWSRYGPRAAGEDSDRQLNLRDLILCKQSGFAFDFCRLLTQTTQNSNSN